MITKSARKRIETAKEIAAALKKDWNEVVKDAAKLAPGDFMELRKRASEEEIQMILGARMEQAANQPTEYIMEPDKPAVFKRRRRIVEVDKDGKWQLKNPPKGKEKGSP
jgi:hypothetical protein